jgi:hypothetical protein
MRYSVDRSLAGGKRRLAVLTGVTVAALAVALGVPAVAATAAPSGYHHGDRPYINCGDNTRGLCQEVVNSDRVFGHYVGHDEPTVLFYSHVPGSGNQMVYRGILPKEPPPTNVPGKHSYDFQYYPAFWFGMVMCATQSAPLTVKNCAPDSDRNITAPGDPYHAGAAYLELQFYPPGYIKQWNGFSCSATKWCVALTIDSLAVNFFTGQQLNSTCAAKVGVEYANFAYLTHNGIPQGPPNPVQFTPAASGNPNPHKVFYLNQGDHFKVTMRDTQHGVQAIVADATSGRSGSMTASAANGFGQVKFAPRGTSCVNLPYDFHPMYSTSTPATTAVWPAATYNVAIDTEVGHFDFCSKVKNAVCVGNEGAPGNQEPADGDDFGCFPAAQATLIKVGGCEGSNVGYDGTSYLNDWPNGNTATRPSPTLFSSPLTGPAFNRNYSQVAFNTDLPAIEGQLGTCNIYTGAGCSLYPPTDDNGAPAQFYPYYTTGTVGGTCYWSPGQVVPGFSTNNYGKNTQYGQLLKVVYPGVGGTASAVYQDFNGPLPSNPCRA